MKRGLSVVMVASVAGAAGFAGLRKRTARAPEPVPPGMVRQIEGEWIHYVDHGSGPAIVLIHGFMGSTFGWRSTIPTLAQGHRVVALDLPGFGFSDRSGAIAYSPQAHAERVTRLMDALGIERAVVIGHSMGGGVAERVAVGFPGRVERLVLVAAVDASVPEDGQHGGRGRGTLAFALASIAFKSPLLVSMGVRRALAGMVSREFATGEVVAGYLAPLLMPGTLACVRRLSEGTADATPVDLSAINVPALIVSGSRDTAVPPSVGEGLAKKIAGARHVVLEGAGHLIAEEQPGAFLAEVEAFLDNPVAP